MTFAKDQSLSKIQPGTTIGSYRVDSKLAQGGMGVIYRARDLKLERPVAIKFLSNELANAEARRRFQREAQLASSLNHPHILTIYDVGEFADRQYLVTEWVDGGTLREWAARERPSWRQIVETIIGVADGVATAHEAGILHRDIKPENILVTRNGYAKLADFGIAKLAEAAMPADPKSATVVTRLGIVIGTPGYMSPEQTTGSKLDARSDVFSFAVVLYELLSGAPPFAGTSEIEVGHAVIHEPMPPLPPKLPSVLRMSIEKALEKDPADRYQTMRDLVVDLRRLARRQIRESGEQAAAAPAVHRRPRASLIAATAIVMAIAAGFWAGTSWIPERRPAGMNANITFQRVTDFIGMEEMPAASPNGTQVAFVATTDGRQQIWLRLLAGGAPLQLTFDAADHEHPRWAPDSSALIYFVPAEEVEEIGTLWEVSALGGTPRRIAPSLGGADLSHDGSRIAALQKENGESVLVILNRDGRRIEPVHTLPRNVDYQTPRWSPDDRSIAFGVNVGDLSWRIYVLDIADGEPEVVTVVRGAMQGFTWLPDGSGVVYASSAGSTLSYPPVFNLRMVSIGDRTEQQVTVGDTSYVQPDMAQAGSLFASRVRMESDIWRFPAIGSPAENTSKAERITRQTGQVQTPSVSPDGTEIVYLSDSGGHSNVWVASTDGSSTRQLTFERDPEVIIGIPQWSPVGDRILYIITSDDGQFEWLINPDGSDQTRLAEGRAANWSWDGRWVYFSNPADECIDRVPVTGGPVERVRCEAVGPIIAPDGETLFFRPSLTQDNELFKATPPDGPAELLASYPISQIPAFPTGYALSPDGRWIAVPLKDARATNIWAIPTDGGPFRRITDFADRSTLITRQVSWSSDGQSIYAAVVDTDADIVLLNGVAVGPTR